MSDTPMQEIVRTGLESVRSHPGGELDGVYIHSDDSPYELTFYQSTRIVAEDGKSKFIKGAVRCVRQSREYKRYLAHLKEDHGMTQCAFQPSIVLDEDVEMEMHHCPLTLYDVCQIILDHILEKGGRCTTLSLADATIHEHFEERIGMVPLTKTAHALVHADHLKIHPRQVYGKWLDLLHTWPLGVSDKVMEKVIRHLRTTDEEIEQAASSLSYRLGHFRTTATPEEMLAEIDAMMV